MYLDFIYLQKSTGTNSEDIKVKNVYTNMEIPGMKVRIDGLNDLKINEVILQNGKTLYDEVHDHSGQKKSQNLLTLPKDCSVLFYINSQGQQRNVPSGLWSTDL